MSSLDEKRLAERIGVSVRTVQRWRVTGEGPRYIRAGVRRIVYLPSEVEQWEADRLCGSRAAEMMRKVKGDL